MTTYFAEPFTGTINFAGDDILASAALRARVHLGIEIAMPCPSCGGRDADTGDHAQCIGGPQNGATCIVEAVSPQFGGV